MPSKVQFEKGKLSRALFIDLESSFKGALYEIGSGTILYCIGVSYMTYDPLQTSYRDRLIDSKLTAGIKKGLIM